MLIGCHLDPSSPLWGEYGLTVAGNYDPLRLEKTRLCLASVPAVPSQLDTNARLTLSVLIGLALCCPSTIQYKRANTCLLPSSTFLKCSRVLQGTESNYNYKYHWAKFMVTDLGVYFLFPPFLFPSLMLKMMFHLDNASILQWTLSHPALDGTSLHSYPLIFSLFFFLQAALGKSSVQMNSDLSTLLQALTFTVWICLYTCFYKWRAIKSSQCQSRATRPW